MIQPLQPLIAERYEVKEFIKLEPKINMADDISNVDQNFQFQPF